jgi:acyl carrier protein/NAD(P)-dependent dehydrogenase (short-subunit alcohol dehydrogenase family)
MEEWGAEIMIACADVSNPERMKAVVKEAETRFGPVNGLIHTAAVIDYGGIIQRRTKEITEAVLAPKAGGLLVLETLFKPEQLDFVVIFSSIASVLTPFGQVGYAAANAFLDAYTFSKSHYNGKYTVINWSDWLDVGMAVKAITKVNEGNPERIRSELESMTPIALTPSEGTEAFHRILAHQHPRIVVCIQELEVMRQFHNRYNTERRGGTGEHTLHRRPELSTEYQPPGNDLENTVAGILQQYLAIDQVGINDNFFELGLSSLDIIQVNMQLKEVLKKEIPLVTMFTYPTIRHFSMYMDMDRQEEAEQILEETEAEQAGELLHNSINLLREK